MQRVCVAAMKNGQSKGERALPGAFRHPMTPFSRKLAMVAGS